VVRLAAFTAALRFAFDDVVMAARRLRKEPEPFEAEYDEDEFEHGEYEVRVRRMQGRSQAELA
jgi:hypothetical protein